MKNYCRNPDCGGDPQHRIGASDTHGIDAGCGRRRHVWHAPTRRRQISLFLLVPESVAGNGDDRTGQEKFPGRNRTSRRWRSAIRAAYRSALLFPCADDHRRTERSRGPDRSDEIFLRRCDRKDGWSPSRRQQRFGRRCHQARGCIREDNRRAANAAERCAFRTQPSSRCRGRCSSWSRTAAVVDSRRNWRRPLRRRAGASTPRRCRRR